MSFGWWRRRRLALSLLALVVVAVTWRGSTSGRTGAASSPSAPSSPAESAGASGGSSRPDAEKAPPVGAPEEVEGAGSQTLVTLVSALRKTQEKSSYIVITVEYTCVLGTCGYDSANWSFQAADDRTYAYESGTDEQSGYGPPLGSGTLRHGQSTEGVLSLRAPAGPGVITLEDGTGGLLAQWRT